MMFDPRVPPLEMYPKVRHNVFYKEPNDTEAMLLVPVKNGSYTVRSVIAPDKNHCCKIRSNNIANNCFTKIFTIQCENKPL